jgi:hypothetical protein
LEHWIDTGEGWADLFADDAVVPPDPTAGGVVVERRSGMPEWARRELAEHAARRAAEGLSTPGVDGTEGSDASPVAQAAHVGGDRSNPRHDVSHLAARMAELGGEIG